MLRLLVALLLLLILPVFAQPSSTLEQFHAAMESFEWERAEKFAMQLPEGGPRELALAEIAVFTERLDLTFPLTDKVRVESLPGEYLAKLFLVRAYQADDWDSGKTRAERSQAVLRLVREGLKQSGSPHDKARLLQLKLEQTPQEQRGTFPAILAEVLTIPGVPEVLQLETQAALARRQGRRAEASTLTNSLASLARLKGQKRAYVFYRSSVASSLATEERKRQLLELWDLAEEQRDPWSLLRVLTRLVQLDRKLPAARAFALMGKIQDGQGKLRLTHHLIRESLDLQARRELALQAELISRRLGDETVQSYFELMSKAGLPNEIEATTHRVRQRLAGRELRGLRASWPSPLWSLLRNPAVPSATFLDLTSLEAGLSNLSAHYPRSEVYSKHIRYALENADARLAQEAYRRALTEALALTDSERWGAVADMDGAPRQILPYPNPYEQRNVLNLALKRSIAAKLVADETLFEKSLETLLEALRFYKGSAEMLNQLASWLYNTGREQEALELLEAANSRSPSNLWIQSELGGLRLLRGDPAAWSGLLAARIALERSTGGEWRESSTLTTAWEAMGAGQWADAEGWALKALAGYDGSEQKADYSGIHQVYALSLARQGLTEEALGAVEAGLALVRQHKKKETVLMRTRADVLLQAGRKDEAAQQLEALERLPLPRMSVYELNLRRAAGSPGQIAALKAEVETFLARPSSMPEDPIVSAYLQAALSPHGLESAPNPQTFLPPPTDRFEDLLEDLERLRRREPDNASLRRLSAGDLKSLMAKAAPNEVYVQPVLMNFSVVLIYLSHDRVGLVETFVDRQRFDQTLARWTSNLSSPDSLPSALAEDQAYLSQRLVQPWRTRFPKATRVLWLGDDAMRRLPLSALPSEGERPLLESMEILHLDGPGQSSLKFDPQVPALMVGGSDDLQGAGRELQAVRKLFPRGQRWDLGQPLADLGGLLPYHRIVHVASHGSRPGGGELSARLGRGEASLTAFQIAGLSFGEGSLAVLGACDSSLDAETGHDNTSLVSAARTAGAEVVVGALWPIDDQVTVQLFTRFYEELRNGQSPERALQLAQRAVAKTRPHPYYWSGFQVVTGPTR